MRLFLPGRAVFVLDCIIEYIPIFADDTDNSLERCVCETAIAPSGIKLAVVFVPQRRVL
ncbi:hypothetical protein SAMN07250955_105209 [Arboricoccus pini]|uniref:Uncharacterized protein n=1 Tax=Arboricoccus pini TaxID=1963835 RepID=A0A212R4A5_9PROT|nr:hypothetical protein SAMN07250955_105209 [Arboricoccus pini]